MVDQNSWNTDVLSVAYRNLEPWSHDRLHVVTEVAAVLKFDAMDPDWVKVANSKFRDWNNAMINDGVCLNLNFEERRLREDDERNMEESLGTVFNTDPMTGMRLQAEQGDVIEITADDNGDRRTWIKLCRSRDDPGA